MGPVAWALQGHWRLLPLAAVSPVALLLLLAELWPSLDLFMGYLDRLIANSKTPRSKELGLLLDGPARALLYGLGFLALYLVDARGLRDYWPAWYLRLRLGLTLAVVICQGLVGLAR